MTDTAFLARAGMLDTAVGRSDRRADPVRVVRTAQMAGQDGGATS